MTETSLVFHPVFWAAGVSKLADKSAHLKYTHTNTVTVWRVVNDSWGPSVLSYSNTYLCVHVYLLILMLMTVGPYVTAISASAGGLSF